MMEDTGTSDDEAELVTRSLKAGCHLMLNRPGALNALNLSVIQALHRQVAGLQMADKPQQLILSGAGTRAFTAGADIKAIYHAGRAWLDGAQAHDPYQNFFAPEYALDAALYHLDRPKTAVMDGIVMGGGYGIAATCDVRIATENTVFAMPETGIGFFADVAAVYHLRQTPGLLGRYCVITGETVTHPRDLLALGVATHYVPSDQCTDLLAELTALEAPDRQTVLAIAGRYHVDPDGDAPLQGQQALIDACFAADDIKSVLARLERYETSFAQQTYRLIETRAPLSLVVTMEHARRGEDEAFDTVIGREHNIAARFMREPCFYEGVRAMLIDKDKQPDWHPPRLSDVDDDIIKHFTAGSSPPVRQ